VGAGGVGDVVAGAFTGLGIGVGTVVSDCAGGVAEVGALGVGSEGGFVSGVVVASGVSALASGFLMAFFFSLSGAKSIGLSSSSYKGGGDVCAQLTIERVNVRNRMIFFIEPLDITLLFLPKEKIFGSLNGS